MSFVVTWRSLCRADHSSRVLQNVLCLNECDSSDALAHWGGGLSHHGGGVQWLARNRKACGTIPRGSSMIWIHGETQVTYLADGHWFIVINYGWSIFLPIYGRLDRYLNADVEYARFESQPQNRLHSLCCYEFSLCFHTNSRVEPQRSSKVFQR